MRIETELPYRAPLDWDSLLEFLARRAIPGLEVVDSERYERTVALDGAAGTIRVERSAAGPVLELRADLDADLPTRVLIERTRRIFDLDADPGAIAAVLARDGLIAEVVERHPGLRVPGCWDGFELAVRAVLGQQVTVRGATTLAGRLVASYGQKLAGGADTLTRLFPSARALAEADLSEVGLTSKRSATIRRLARDVAAGRLQLEPGSDLGLFESAMLAIPGIGEWTVQYVAMRALREPDAFPASDLVLLKSAGGATGRLTARELVSRAEAWRPWRAYAAVHLWKRA